MLSLILAALLQAAPEAAAAAPKDIGLPKDDYRLVAWCHGALAGQLELDPVAKADMEKIEGKAKVAARAKADAEMEKERRQYLKDYEQALAAAESASPTNIHQNGVEAEVQGYRLWTATRNKEPIWRMLDWGMWDPNDVGCGDAAKRLYNRASLFGEALKGTSAENAKTEPVAAPLAAKEDPSSQKTTEAKPVEEKSAEASPVVAAAEAPPAATPSQATETAVRPAETSVKPEPMKKTAKTARAIARTPAAPKIETPAPSAEPAVAVVDKPVMAEAPVETAAKSQTQPAKATPVKKAVKVAAKAMPVKKKPPVDSAAEDIRAAIAAGKAETVEKPAEASKPSDPGLRGPQ